MADIPESLLKLVIMHEAFSKARIEVWNAEILWSWRWWLLIVLMFAPWIFWWRFVDKKRLTEICLFGMFILATSSWMDELGTELILWYYPYKTFALYPQLVPINYTVIPITFMLVYQYKKSWKTYIFTLVIIAAIYSWVAEPILNLMGIYKPINWKYSYSFPLYVLIGISHRWLLEGILRVTRKNSDDI
ncbi:hypothetical protein H1S01_04485 [Heliobacterium chlorum]|uniref:Uncharacterized protein n=1 Tax=Heliobacterium chlorum TaxID=2698 RepID=A0ABR7SZ08_HELCL|nr:CBO0543 family protein [Heliobacterium chlorum]MBC9783769.1 hypothetical protein [Heliobacterium chlorum]